MEHTTRRKALLTGTMAVAGAALASRTDVAAANSEQHGSGRPPHAERAGGAEGSTMDEPEAFDEIYLGRHIQGRPAPDEHTSHPGSRSRRPGEGPSPVTEFVVRIDDRDLHVMRSMDGTWLSVVNHYQKQRTPLEVARAAVRDLDGASLVPLMA